MVLISPEVIYCPFPSCDHILSTLNAGCCQVLRCKYCYYEACAVCHEVSHAPATCEEKQNWESLFGNENDALREKVKVCPTCGLMTERRKGCLEMQCTKCSTKFCWGCRKIGGHDDHFQCPYYKPPAPKGAVKQEGVEPYSREFNKFKKLTGDVISSMRNILRLFKNDAENEITVVLKQFFAQFCCAAANLQWSNVHLFYLSRELNINEIRTHQTLFTASMRELQSHVDEAENLIRPPKGDQQWVSLQHKLEVLTRRLKAYRMVLLKQADPHY
jgi:hypothetical protein